MDAWNTLIKVGRTVTVDGKSGRITAIRYQPYKVYVWFDGASRSTEVVPDSIKES